MFSKFFSLYFPLGSACWLGHGAAAPEARHRCIGQPATATMSSSSGSSRPRQPWMRRAKTAVASDEGFEVGKPLEVMGSLREEVDDMLKVQVFLNASLLCGKCFDKTFGTDFLCCSL